MIIFLHVMVALVSMAFTTYLYIAPSRLKLYAAYGLIGLTLASGTYLVVSTPAHMLESCVTGLVYLAVVSAGVMLARKKLAATSL